MNHPGESFREQHLLRERGRGNSVQHPRASCVPGGHEIGTLRRPSHSLWIYELLW